MKRRKKCPADSWLVPRSVQIIIALLSFIAASGECTITLKGIPTAFGDINSNKRTDIITISGDGKTIDIHDQNEIRPHIQSQPPESCKSQRFPIVQVYLADIDRDGNPNILPLLLTSGDSEDKTYRLVSLKSENDQSIKTKLNSSPTYSLATSAALNSDGSLANSSSNTPAEAEAQALSRSQIHPCDFELLGVEMTAQPFLFDLDGDLTIDFMSLDMKGDVAVWSPPKNSQPQDSQFKKSTPSFVKDISKDFFMAPHSNAFININDDSVADIVLSSRGQVAYLYADPTERFKFVKNFSRHLDYENYEYGQSSLYDIDADGKIDHIMPRCNKSSNKQCEIISISSNGHVESIFKFTNETGPVDPYTYNYRLETIKFAKDYEFPVTLRGADLDGDGFTDFVTIAKDVKNGNNKNVVLFLHNVPLPEKLIESRTMKRTFEPSLRGQDEIPSDHVAHLVSLFDVNEDGKIDLLIGHSEANAKNPGDMNVSTSLNKMFDACFMKVLVTNGYTNEHGSHGQGARGPFVCFELTQNDENKMKGCAGQLSQSSYFSLQQPYVIFGLGQTPHFVEKMWVTIPGFGRGGTDRTRVLEQIVPDAQIIIIPKDQDDPDSWGYKMFLSPMSELVPPTLIALSIICVIILIIIFILHRQETLEDAAEHEEYKRHWPESR